MNKKKIFSLMREIQFEITNLCDLSCIMCPRTLGYLESRPKGFMDESLLWKLVGELVSLEIELQELYLFWLGEPTLHPSFDVILERLIESATKKGWFRRIEFDTNGNYLQELAPLLVKLSAREEPRIERIFVSIDAPSEQAYSRIRRGGSLQKVEKGLVKLVDERKKRGSSRPFIVITMVLQTLNYEFIGEFRSRYGELLGNSEIPLLFSRNKDNFILPSGDCLFVRPLYLRDKKSQEEADRMYIECMRRFENSSFDASRTELLACTNSVGSRETAFERKAPCEFLFRRPLIGWDGLVTFCFADEDFSLSPGSLLESTFEDIWTGKNALELRKLHFEQKSDRIGRCSRGCGSYRPLERLVQ